MCEIFGVQHGTRTSLEWRRVACGSALLWIACCMAGCSGGHPHAVNPVRAREVLKTTMEAWKGGKTPEDMQKLSPPIIVQDFDWIGEKKLTEYEINSKDGETGANLTCQVTLHLVDKEGNAEEKAVYYVVGTSPGLSVFRDAR